MSNPNKTSIVFLLDMSGSMAPLQETVIETINKVVSEQKETLAPNELIDITLVNFPSLYLGGSYSVVNWLAGIGEFVPLNGVTYCPSGGTPLYDALGDLIENFGNALSEQTEDNRPSKVKFFIFTDGEENASRRRKSQDISDMIQHQTDVYKWQFIYLGANHDAMKASQSLGISAGNTVYYSGNVRSLKAATRGVSDYLMQARTHDADVMADFESVSLSTDYRDKP